MENKFLENKPSNKPAEQALFVSVFQGSGRQARGKRGARVTLVCVGEGERGEGVNRAPRLRLPVLQATRAYTYFDQGIRPNN